MFKPVTIKDVSYLHGALKIDGMYEIFTLPAVLSNAFKTDQMAFFYYSRT